MSGFRQDPLQFINLITDNLRDRYRSGFPVIKELIQNTDDSTANNLQFGRSLGIPNAQHPLLNGPGLFLINNGRFKPSDAAGIFSFGQNSKAAEEASIGKFGLGMKSVFHFCEAFFFLAHDGAKAYNEVLNPWHGSDPEKSLHSDWDSFSENDGIAIRNHLSVITKRMSSPPNQLFVLWLPLRKKDHLKLANGEISGSIISEFPGDNNALLSFLEDTELPVKIAALLPMLSHLEKVGYWNLSGKENSALSPEFEVSFIDPGKRISLVHEVDENGEVRSTGSNQPLSGKTHVAVKQASRKLFHTGLESYQWNDKLKALHESTLWPSSYVRNELGHAHPEKDKAKPHAAVLFSRISGSGELITNWSVFLPLDENKTVERIPCSGKYTYRLTLHGYFFVDAGRQGVHGLSDCDRQHKMGVTDESTLRAAWNCQLSRSAVFPLVLPALDVFCKEQQLAGDDKIILTKTFSQTKLYRDFREQLTSKYNWICEITQEGTGWHLVNANTPILFLPLPPGKDIDRPWRLFPGLRKVSEQKKFALQDSPNLIHPDAQGQWSEDEILILLESIDVQKVFTTSTLLEYLASFLDEVAGPFIKTLVVQKTFRNLVKKALMQIGESELAQNQKRISVVLNHLEPDLCFKIDSNLPTKLLHRLLFADIQYLLIPALFWPPQFKTANPSMESDDVRRLLEKVEKTLEAHGESDKTLQESALKISEKFIKSVKSADRSSLLARCTDLRVLAGYDCQNARRTPVSVQEIRQARDAGVLFGFTQGITEKDRLGLALHFQKVLPKERILIINADTYGLTVSDNSKLSPCYGSEVLKSLGKKRRVLAGTHTRAELVKKAGIPTGDIEIRGLRFLLHADEKRFDDGGDLWVLGYEQDHVWEKLWSSLFGQAINLTNLLEREIVESLPQSVWGRLGIKEIQKATVLEKLKDTDLQNLDTYEFGRDECEQVLRAIQDEVLWRSVPFHWSERGTPISGDATNVFIRTNNTKSNLNELSGIDLILISDKPDIADLQHKWLHHFDDQALINIALNQDDVSKQSLLIMDTLQRIHEGKGINPIESPLQNKIRKTAWLADNKDELFKPEDVIDLEVAVDELERVLSQEPGAFTIPKNLNNVFQQHSFFSELGTNYFSNSEAGLEQLSLALEEIRHYQIGSIEFEHQKSLVQTAKLLGDYRHAGWQLLAIFVEKMGAEICLKILVPSLSGSILRSEVLEILNWTAQQGGDLSFKRQVYSQYLPVFAKDSGAAESISELKLLNQEGQWLSADCLTSGVVGVSPAHLLDNIQARIISRLIHQNSQNKEELTEDSDLAIANLSSPTANILRTFFLPWSGRVSDSMIGAFILLFGRDLNVVELCEEFMGQHSRDWLINRMPWVVVPGTSLDGRKEWLHGCSLGDALNRFEMALHIHDKDKIEVQSILGDTISVDLDKKFSTLLVGSPSYTSQSSDNYLVKLSLRQLDLTVCSDEDLSHYLRVSIEYLLKEVYNQKNPNLDELWSELDQSDQVDIELAKALILDNIPFYLKQLGAHKHTELEKRLRAFREAERKEKEFKGHDHEAKYRKSKEVALKDLQSVIESDSGVQNAILKSVRGKIRDYQYQSESVPFELFQNADDALYDLEKIDAYPAEPGGLDVEPLPPSICRVVVESQHDHIIFMHWGRTINQCGRNGFPGEKMGFDRDLENMLILSASDKGEEVTGKFGLGFKSVWLITDEPLVVSGRLQTKVLGGLLPVPVNDAVSIRKKLAHEQQDKKWPGTAISIPLKDVAESEVLEKFVGMAGAMVAFARKVRSINIKRSDRPDVSVAWEGERIPGLDNILVGRIRQSGGDPLMVMKFSLDEGALLLAIGPNGFVSLPKEFPNLWVTSPIHEQDRLGFAINAMFEVDAGRSRLSAAVEENRELASRLGSQLGNHFKELQKVVSSSWIDITSVMELSPGLEPYIFWHSLWEVLFSHIPRIERERGIRIIATELIRGAFDDLVKSAKVVPNGLPAGMERLLCSQEVRVVFKGALSDSEILTAIAASGCFQSILDVESAISSDVATGLKIIDDEFSRRTDQWISLSLQDILSKVGVTHPISVKDASILGKVLNKKILDEWLSSESTVSKEAANDFRKAIEAAIELQFLAVHGKSNQTRILLSDLATEEEKKRWGFAPDNNRLSNEYDEHGVKFFRLCRDKMEAPAERLCAWIFDAKDNERKEAALRYLLDGELARQVISRLQQKGLQGSWLTEVNESSIYLSDWAQIDLERLVYQILPSPEESKGAFLNYQPAILTPDRDPINPATALANIYDWWESERGEMLPKYQKKTYPEDLKLTLLEDDTGRIDRSSWLKLLLLGGFHTMGRVRSEQNRDFIEDCQRRGWWDIFSNSSPEQHFDDWMGVLDQYIDQQVDSQEYEQWMMRFPIIYKLSRYLDDYVELLLGLERYSKPFDLESALTPLKNPDQQGGGISAPPLGKTLGKGANFIIREMLRHGVVESVHLREHAFVPYKRVCDAFSDMGCDDAGWSENKHKSSTAIYEFIKVHLGEEKMSFCGDYDIPLRIVSHDWNLQEQLLGRELNNVENQ